MTHTVQRIPRRPSQRAKNSQDIQQLKFLCRPHKGQAAPLPPPFLRVLPGPTLSCPVLRGPATQSCCQSLLQVPQLSTMGLAGNDHHPQGLTWNLKRPAHCGTGTNTTWGGLVTTLQQHSLDFDTEPQATVGPSTGVTRPWAQSAHQPLPVADGVKASAQPAPMQAAPLDAHCKHQGWRPKETQSL